MKPLYVLLVLPLLIVAQEYEKHRFESTKGEGVLPFRLLLPKNYNPKKKYPLLVFLHGAGERGLDNELQLTHGSRLFLTPDNRKNFPVIVAFPQCPENSYWAKIAARNPFRFHKEKPINPQLDLLEEWLAVMQEKYPVQSDQIYVGGLSMGGMGTLELLYRNPTKFAAAFTICGGVDPSWAEQIQHTPLWLFHGKLDAVVSYQFSADLHEALVKKNAPVKFTSYPNYNHNSWDAAFQEPDFLSWLLTHKRTSP